MQFEFVCLKSVTRSFGRRVLSDLEISKYTARPETSLFVPFSQNRFLNENIQVNILTASFRAKAIAFTFREFTADWSTLFLLSVVATPKEK